MNNTTIDLSALFANTTPLLIAFIVSVTIAAACSVLAMYCTLNRYNGHWYTRTKPRHIICTASIALGLIVVGLLIALVYASFPATNSIMDAVEHQTGVTELSCGNVTRGQMRDNTLQCTFSKNGKHYQGVLIVHNKTATLYKSATIEPMPVTTTKTDGGNR